MSAVQSSLAGLFAPWVTVAADATVTAVTLDSRSVTPGALFLAVAGSARHGIDFLQPALEAGAAAIAYDPMPEVDSVAVTEACARRGAIALQVPELGRRASAVAARFHGHPAREMRVVGVTGTDGKTSVSQFLAQALDRPGGRCGVLGTLGWGFPDDLRASANTTPDAVTVQRCLARLLAEGATAVVLEASSHALDQYRVEAVPFNVAVLTNLSRDHLDYHGTEEAYAQAKARLFAWPGLGACVLNLDDDFGRRLADRLRAAHTIGYSIDGAAGAVLRCLALEAQPRALRLALVAMGRPAALRVPLLGRFNAANVLAALGALLVLDLPLADALERLRRLRPVAGRMECHGGNGRPWVVVDYAHTPAGLQAALAAMREHFPGRIWCVFGCGGDRDRGKRALMGALVRAKADRVVITSDNPRGEDPHRIIADIQAGADADSRVMIMPNRREAVIQSIRAADPEDAILVAGKGHEEVQLIGSERLPYSDRETVKRALEDLH
ncbi:MAG: UDP-N-acetylmuramoyl-L-alanyl-D-glutamate--2,6-diaminopimelate ligase [Nitrococcus sp.]|nr:UDP-N-acetylmuramoyl-L-alanyl-D-glutamate--2,6-diaminopimelate ligase [Nitrococcus sp.]